MRFHHSLVLVCAATLGVSIIPQVGNAQDTSASHDPFTLITDPTPLPAGSPATQADGLSLIEPPGQHAPMNDSLDSPIYACACGCGIFEVGTASMLPMGQGGMLYLEYDYQDQNINWNGVRPAPRSANSDRELRTNFFTLGLEYFFDRSWGVQVEIPYANRHFNTYAGDGGNHLDTLQWGAFGDVRLQGIYTGFSEDQSIGVNFGLKLPTGNDTHNDRFDGADRDSELGTGTIDLLAGGFFRHEFTSHITGFAQLALDVPVDEYAGYRPGLEADGSLGAYYTGISIGGVNITPIGQVLLAERGHDSGPNAAHPISSGYQRLLLSPGLEFDMHPFSIYADIEVPVYQHFSGEQLTAPFLMKVILTYHF